MMSPPGDRWAQPQSRLSYRFELTVSEPVRQPLLVCDMGLAHGDSLVEPQRSQDDPPFVDAALMLALLGQSRADYPLEARSTSR